MAPTWKEISSGRAGFLWNLLCCPIIGTLGLVFTSLKIYCGPCLHVLIQRMAVGCLWKNLCCCINWPYEDDDFFGAAALGDHDEKKASEMEAETDWVRAEDLKSFEGKRPQLFEGDIEPSDLCQGSVGDCWLVAAFACGSEFPQMIRRMFITKEYNPRGRYQVRIFDPIKRKHVVITVDDRIPCKKGTKKPRFMSPNGNELWAIILEKAYAKFCGSYGKLAGGFVLWGWHSMTGDNVFQLSKNVDTGKWEREDMKPIEKENDKRACGFYSTKEKYDDENIWTLLKKYDRQKALLSASIGKTEYREANGPAGEQMLEEEGLVAGHAYSVISAKEFSESMFGGKKLRLLRIRNPWGTYEWKGDWSDKSKLWKDHPNVAKQAGYKDEDDGTFFMAFEDFIEAYTRVNVCDRDTRNDAALDVQEDAGCCGVFLGCFLGCLQYYVGCQGYRNLYCSHASTDETLDATETKCCFVC